MGFLDFFTGDQPPLIKGALNDVCVMVNTGRDMFAAASAHLLDNEILEMDLAAQHAAIEVRECAARRAVLEHLNLDPKRELVLCVKLITVVHEAERIGALSSTMGLVARLVHFPRLTPDVDDLRDIRSRIHRFFDEARDSFLAGDPERARALLTQQVLVKSNLIQYLHDLAERSLACNAAVVYTMAAYVLLRTGTHLANIASVVTSPFDQIRSGVSSLHAAQRAEWMKSVVVWNTHTGCQ